METWRGVVDGVLSKVTHRRELDDEVVNRTTRELIHEPFGYLVTEETFAALEKALRTDAILSEVIRTPHSERTIREFLGKVVTRMDALRPWPEPDYRPLPLSAREHFADDPVARIGMSYPYLGMSVGDVFDPAGDEHVLVWHLRSGAELAFVGPWWPGSDDVAVLLRDSRHSPRQVISELIGFTRLVWEDVSLLTAEAGAGEGAPRETDPDLRNQWVFLVDPAWKPAEEVEPPAEAVVGGWFVAEDRTLGAFRPNSAYEPSEPGLPADPVDAALQLVVSGQAEVEELFDAAREISLGLAVDEEGFAVVAPAPDGVPSVLVATAPSHRERVNVPGWRDVTVRDLAEGLPSEGIDVLLNPGAPASMRIIAKVLKDFVAQDDTDDTDDTPSGNGATRNPGPETGEAPVPAEPGDTTARRLG